MLKAMKEQLLSLAKDENKEFHTVLRKRIGKKATSVLEDRLKRSITLLPDLVSRIYFYWNRGKSLSQTKHLGGYLLTYLYEPDDFLSNKKWGLFGYLDDAYFVVSVYSKVILEELAGQRKISAMDLGFYEETKSLIPCIKSVLPEETRKIDDMINGIYEGDKQVFLSAFNSRGV